MLFSVFYLFLFLSVGLLSARRAVPDGSAAVIVPLGCGFGVSLLAVLPALFAVVLGFHCRRRAGGSGRGGHRGSAFVRRRLRGMAKDPRQRGPVGLPAAGSAHHAVSAAHPRSASGGRARTTPGRAATAICRCTRVHQYIAQSGEFLPRYPLLGGTHRFGYPFLCETVSSVFVVLGPTSSTAYLLPMLPAFLSVYGMFWQLARRVTDSAGKACLAFYLVLYGQRLGFASFGSADSFAGIFYRFSQRRRILEKTSSGSIRLWICLSPAGDVAWLVRAAARRLSPVAVLL